MLFTTKVFKTVSPTMHVDLFLAALLISLGAMIAYALDEQFALTPRVAEWLGRVLGPY
jgi:hypothetical protein